MSDDGDKASMKAVGNGLTVTGNDLTVVEDSYHAHARRTYVRRWAGVSGDEALRAF